MAVYIVTQGANVTTWNMLLKMLKSKKMLLIF